MIRQRKEKRIEFCEFAPRQATMRADYVWEEVYKAAILETDDEKLPDRIGVAKGAIDQRIQQMQMDHGGTAEERQAVTDALAGISVLRRELERRLHETGSSNA
jgi:hypothetical protein